MSISIAAEVQQKRFWGFDGRGMPRPRKLFWKLSHKWCWESHSTGHQEAGNTSPRCGCACLATQAAQRLSDEGQFPSTRDHGEGKMSALRNSGGRMLAVQAESRPSCPRFGQPGAAVPTHPWTGETPVPTRTVMAVTVFCEIRIPIPGPVNAAMTTGTWSGRERLLQ